MDERSHADVSRKTSPALAGRPEVRTLSFRLLGPIEIRSNGEAIELGRRMQRTLLALLLVRVGEFVSTNWLVDELWPASRRKRRARHCRTPFANYAKFSGPRCC